MMRPAPLAAVLLAAACAPALPPTPAPGTAPPPAQPAAQPAATSPVRIDQQDELTRFLVEWPRPLEAFPALADWLRADAARARATSFEGVAEDKAYRDQQGYPFHPYDYALRWTLAGRTARLLSLSGSFSVFTGGAHPNHGTRALLWPTGGGDPIAFAALFRDAAERDRLLKPRWCAALAAERARRRAGQSMGADFESCPALTDLAIVPADRNANGRFDTLSLTADPYVAGPYSEGKYALDLAVDPALLAALDARWTADFEVAQPQ